MEHFSLIVEFNVNPEHLRKFEELIEINAHTSFNEESGCLQFDVTQGIDDPCKVVLYEIYLDEAAFHEHMTKPHTASFLKAAGPMIRSQQVWRQSRSISPGVKPLV